MVEVPTTVGASGIKLNGINLAEHDQFVSVVSQIEEYSQHLVTSFENTAGKINSAVVQIGDVALKALENLSKARDEMQLAADESYQELESIMNEVDTISTEFDGLDAIQKETLLLSDLLTTVEESLKRP